MQISLLSLARNEIERIGCLRADGRAEDDDEILTSLVQFDALANLVAIDGAGDATSRVSYPNFACFRQECVVPIIERLLVDPEMRAAIFSRSDEGLAVALGRMAEVGQREGVMYDGSEAGFELRCESSSPGTALSRKPRSDYAVICP